MNLDQACGDVGGYNPVFVAALSGRLDIVRCLVDGGASTNLSNKGGMGPLYAAAQNGFLDIVTYLVEAGSADMNHAANDGR